MPRLQFKYNSTPTLEYYPSEGVPSSAELSIYSSGLSKLVDGATITLDSASQAVSSVSKNDSVLTVSDSSNFVVGRRYWLSTAGGRGTEVVLMDIPSSTTLELDEPVPFAISSGTIKGHGLRYNLTSSVTGNLRRRLRAEFTYTVNSVQDTDYVLFDVVYLPFKLELTLGQIEEADPSFGERVDNKGKWKNHMIQAEKDVFRFLKSKQIKPDLCRERDLLEDAAVYRVLELFYVRNQSTAGTQEDIGKKYGKMYKDALGEFYEGHHWYDSDEDLVADLGLSTVRFADGSTYDFSSYGDENVGTGGSLDETKGPPSSYLKVG